MNNSCYYKTAFNLRWLLSVYDAVNVIIAAYIACVTLNYKLTHRGLLLCNPIQYGEEGDRIARVFALFYFQKYFEFFDTWFFLLRKSFRQVTFLHLFHHSSITVFRFSSFLRLLSSFKTHLLHAAGCGRVYHALRLQW